jgi:hypothetical protein
LRWREPVLPDTCLHSGKTSSSRFLDLRVECPKFASLFVELNNLTDNFVPLTTFGFCAGESPLSTASRCFCLLNSVPCPDRCTTTSSNAFFLSSKKKTYEQLQLKITKRTTFWHYEKTLTFITQSHSQVQRGTYTQKKVLLSL